MHALGQLFATPAGGERGEHQIMLFGVRDQPARRVRRMNNVGVGKHQIFGREFFLRGRNPLLHRPELAGPARRQRTPAHNNEPVVFAERSSGSARDIRRAVAAVIIDQHDRERRIILADERRDALRNVLGLVACRYHDRELRQYRRERFACVIALAAEPKSAAREYKINPGSERQP